MLSVVEEEKHWPVDPPPAFPSFSPFSDSSDESPALLCGAVGPKEGTLKGEGAAVSGEAEDVGDHDA